MHKLFEGNIYKNFIKFSVPLILTVILSQGYNIINTIMSGYLIGDAAISAIGSTSPLISFISSVCWGFGTGFSIYIAMLYGSEDYKKMFNVLKVTMLISSAFVIVISAFCIIFSNSILDFLNVKGEIRIPSLNYFIIYISGLVFLYFNWCGLYISNSLGLTKLPFFASIITNILNILLNFIFIKICRIGVGGTALATIVSAFVVALFYIFSIAKVFKELGVDFKEWEFSKEELKYSLSFAFPTMLQQSIMYLCTALVSPLTNLCGDSAIAGYSVGMRIYDLNSGVYQNSNKTVSSYIAQCIGAKKHSQIKKGIKAGLIMSIAFLTVFLAPSVFGANFVSNMFLEEKTAIHYSNIFLYYCMPFIFFNVINNLLHAVFRSSGSGNFLVISTLIYAISRFGFSYLLYPKYHMYGIFAAIVLSWIVEAIFNGIVYFSGKWKTEEYRKFENDDIIKV